MPKKYVVLLQPDERVHLLDVTQNGHALAKQLARSRILLKADETSEEDGWSDEVIHKALDVSIATIERVREQYVKHGLDAVLRCKGRSRERRCQLDYVAEPHLIALAGSEAPAGHAHRTLRLLSWTSSIVK